MKQLKKNERWISGYEGKYFLNNLGEFYRVYKTASPKQLRGYISHGRYVVKLTSNKTTKEYGAHILVWKAFNGTIPKGYIVARKTGILLEIQLHNLYLITKSEWGKKTGHRSASYEVIELDDSGNEINSWRSARRAAKDLHCSYQTVMNICNKKVKKPLFNLKWGEMPIKRDKHKAAKYLIRDNTRNNLIIFKACNATEAAIFLGITYKSFFSSVSRKKIIGKRYTVERVTTNEL